MPSTTIHEVISWWQAILLGLVQGLTEFIPVSSSAHLNIAHHFLGQKTRHLSFDLMLHIGTLAALAWYFRKDWAALLTDKSQARLRNLVLLACVPAAVVGLVVRDAEEKYPIFTDPHFNARMLLIAGAVLWGADMIGRKNRGLGDIRLPDALVVGCTQALALVPGVSRSGSTMTAGLLMGLDRSSAARFSFLMSLPITLGAILSEVKKVMGEHVGFSTPDAPPLILLLGIVVSGVSGFAAISFLLEYLKKHSMSLFFVWRALVAAAVFLLIKS